MISAFPTARGTAFVCQACRRHLARLASSSSSPRRAAFHAYTLPAQTPSTPRNAGAPETSITHPIEGPAIPRVQETRAPERAAPTRQPKPPFATTADAAAVSSPAAAVPTKADAPTARKPAGSRLRAPRKAAMRLTEPAVERLRALLEQPDPKLIKVGVRNRGCSGLAYHLEFVDKAGAFDETVEQDGVRVLIDSKALFSIIGSEMDWVEDKLSQRFVFRNPNIKEECGCGESFMV